MISRMFRALVSVVAVSAFSLLAPGPLQGQARSTLVPNRLTQPINSNARVTLKGTVHPLANALNDRGVVPASMPLNRIQIVLKRSPEQEAALKQLIEEQNQPGSANYHKWLTPVEFGQEFGPSDQDVATLEAWLQSQGFNIEKLNPGRQTLDVSGSAAQFENAFHAQIHKYLVNGETHFANATNPQIPAALAPVFGGFVSLNDFRIKPKLVIRGKATYNPKTGTAVPQWTIGSSSAQAFVVSPADFATQYDLTPLYNAGTTGAGQTIAIINESNINVAVVNDFRTTFGLPANPPHVVIDGNDPGIDGVNDPDGPNGASIEAYVDTEWAGAVAPLATVDLVIAADTALESGLVLAAEHAIYGNIAPVMSFSFGACEAGLGNENAFINSLWEQAAAQGITVLVASGDEGSAGCDDSSQEEYATQGAAVSGFASTPYNVAVGGTDFYYSSYNQGSSAISSQLASYWNTTPSNGAATISIKGYVPEQPWNDSQYGLNVIGASQGSSTIGGGGGGPSTCITGTVDPSTGMFSACTSGYAKPAWQTPGVPNDKVRDIPDVSLFASDGSNESFYPICADDGDCQGAGSSGVIQISGGGGTSFASPSFAGIMALVNQRYGRQGQADAVLYPLAKQFPAAFHDVTVGTNSVPCAYSAESTQNSIDCIAVANPITITDPNSGALILEGQIGTGTTAEYNAGPGYDLASGLGSVDATQLVNDWGSVTFASSTVDLTSPSAGASFTHGTSVSITGTVTGSSPTGSVALMTDSTEQGQQAQGNAQILSGGQGVFTVTSGAFSGSVNTLPGGTYNVWAQYSGDTTNAPSTSQKTQITVTPEASTTYFNVDSMASGFTGQPAISSGASVPYGTQLALSAQPVSTTYYNQCISAATPPASCTSEVVASATGTVTFTDTGATLNVASINADGDATYNGAWGIGAHSVTASYSGDKSYLPSSASAISFTVTKDTPEINMGTDVTTTSGALAQGQSDVITIQVLNSANLNNETTYSSTLFSSPVAAPTGTVTISGLPSGVPTSATLLAGVDPSSASPAGIATITLPASTPAGNYTIGVSYSGDQNYASATTSQSITLQNLGGTPSSITATMSGSISPTSQVTISGTVTGKSGGPAPSNSGGGVLIYSSGYNLPQEVAVTPGSGDSSTFSTIVNSQTLLQGANTITVQYMGDSTYGPSAITLTNPILNPLADFTLTPATSLVPVTAGTAATDVVQVASVNGFAGAVSLTCTAASGITCSVPSGATLTSGGNTAVTVTLNASSSATNGMNDVLITAQDSTGKYVHTLGLRADVSGATTAAAGFSVSAGPATLMVAPGATTGNTAFASVLPLNGFTGTVSLTAAITSSPSGATSPPTLTFSPASLDITGQSAISSALAIATTSTTTEGNYTVTVTGTSGTEVETGQFTVNVSAATFALGANPGSLTLAAGATTGNTTTITVTPSGGFTGAVNFTCAVTTAPANANDPPTCSAPAANVTGSAAATATLTVATTATTTSAAHVPLNKFFTAGGGLVVAGLLFFGIPARRRKWRSVLMILVFAGITGFGIGCGSSGGSGSGGGGGGGGTTTIPGTTAGSYVLTVTAKDAATGQITATTTVNLTVN